MLHLWRGSSQERFVSLLISVSRSFCPQHHITSLNPSLFFSSFSQTVPKTPGTTHKAETADPPAQDPITLSSAPDHHGPGGLGLNNLHFPLRRRSDKKARLRTHRGGTIAVAGMDEMSGTGREGKDGVGTRMCAGGVGVEVPNGPGAGLEGEDGMRGGAVAGEMSGAEIGIGMGPGAEAETTGTTGEPGTGAGGGVVVGAGAGKGRESDGLGRKRSVVGSTEPVRQGWLDICHAISQLKRPSVIVEGKVYPSHLL